MGPVNNQEEDMNDYFCSQNIQRLGEFAKWPGESPRLPWHVDLSGYRGSLTPVTLIDAFSLAWSWWADAAEINPFFVQTAAEASVRCHFARIDGPSGILAWSELADNTSQPKTQRYDSGENWTTEWFLQAVIAHELGHVLGLEHDGQNSGTLMAPFIQESVRKPTPRDIQRLLGLGYRKRITPVPTPMPGPAPNVIRLSKELAAGTYGDLALGSRMTAGDYMMLLLGDEGGEPPVP